LCIYAKVSELELRDKIFRQGEKTTTIKQTRYTQNTGRIINSRDFGLEDGD